MVDSIKTVNGAGKLNYSFDSEAQAMSPPTFEGFRRTDITKKQFLANPSSPFAKDEYTTAGFVPFKGI